MKKIIVFALSISTTLGLYAQEKQEETSATFKYSTVAKSMKVVTPTFDEPVLPINEDGKTYVVRNKMRRNKYANTQNALPKGGDPILQKQRASHINKAPIINFDGLNESESGGATPPDPSGAVGPNHYVQMVNSVYRIFDKNGNPLTTPAALGSLLGGGNAGDPIVMYDKFADRWFLSQFSYQNELIVAISQTPDPTGAYYLYTFGLQSFPDYPKYSVWSDGYYVTANKSGDNVFVLERDKMIAGDMSASIIALTIPSLSTPGFFSVLPATASSTLPPAGTPNYLFYYQDDAWSGVANDELKVWEVNVDWATPSNSNISAPQSLAVSPFDSQFDANWNDIEQPNTSAKLDAVPGALMYMGHYRDFGTHSSIVLNHTVDVNGNNLAGIRWYELRKTGNNPWTLYQEGTFNPDTESRWMGSIAMDSQGNIGLAYSVSGHTTYPSLKYTGRYASDPLGQMTLAEEVIVNGNSAQTSPNRFGDYAQMTIDPNDDNTFWFTGEYLANNQWNTRVVSFKIANDFDHDIGVTALTNPTSGTLTNSEQITININNFGLTDESNFTVAYQINNGTPVVETYSGTLASLASTSYTFTTPADMSTIGVYNIKVYTDLGTDQARTNDTTFVDVEHLSPNNVGVTAITSPSSSTTLTGNEVVTVTLQNFGSATQTSIPVHYTINNGTPISETFNGTLASGATASYSFVANADLSSLGSYAIKAYSSLAGDVNLSNDTTIKQVEHTMCAPIGNCSFQDGFQLVKLNQINNSTTCSPNGYGDYTTQSTVLEQGVTYNLILQSGYDDQHGTVWVDFNDNFNFESNEIIILNHLFGMAMDTVDFVVPANASLGEHLMRMRTNWDSDIDDACVDVDYGETEDYTVNIISFTGVKEEYQNVALQVLTQQDNKFIIQVENLNEAVDIEVRNSIGQKILQDKFSSTGSYNLDLSSVATGYYLIRISNQNISKIAKVWVR